MSHQVLFVGATIRSCAPFIRSRTEANLSWLMILSAQQDSGLAAANPDTIRKMGDLRSANRSPRRPLVTSQVAREPESAIVARFGQVKSAA